MGGIRIVTCRPADHVSILRISGFQIEILIDSREHFCEGK